MTAAMSQFSSFSAVRIFRWLQSLKLSGYTAVQQNLHWAAAATRGVPQWRRTWGRVEALQAGGCGVAEGLTF